jgi:hypothetical protein
MKKGKLTMFKTFGHLTNHKQNVEFWTFLNYYSIKGRLSAKGRMCQKKQKNKKNY